MKFLLIYVPNLRFSQFIEPWSNYVVSELLSTFPTNSLSWDQLTNKQDSSLKNLHYGLIHNGFAMTCITGDNQLFPYIKHSFIPTKYALIQNGDLILADASEDRKDVGRPVEMLDIRNQKIVSGLHTIHARNKTDLIANGFKGFYFQSSAMKQQIFKIANGSKIYGISSSAFNELKMSIPEKKEQKKIVDLMIKIEERILTQIKIIELKQSLIKDIEDRILWKTTNTQTKPIREFLTEINNKSIIQNQYPLLSSTKKGLFLQTDYFNKEAASSNNIGYKIVHKGDIIISPQNLWMGNITYNDKFDNGLVSPSYRIYKVKEEYNAFYISRILMSYRALSLYKNISEQGASIVRRNLNVDAFNELCFPIPNIKKQDEVGLFLSKLHQELKCETWILMQLKSQKNYLLNNMFI